MEPVHVLALAGVAFWIYQLVKGLRRPRARRLWEGSVRITDPELLQWYEQLWWETYAVIAPEHRVNHAPTTNWFLYQDHHFLPTYMGNRLIGWWSGLDRIIFVTPASIRNAQLIRHECAHDIMHSVGHDSRYFSDGTYVMRQFR